MQYVSLFFDDILFYRRLHALPPTDITTFDLAATHNPFQMFLSNYTSMCILSHLMKFKHLWRIVILTKRRNSQIRVSNLRLVLIFEKDSSTDKFISHFSMRHIKFEIQLANMHCTKMSAGAYQIKGH